MEITFLYFDGCPSHEEALERLKQVLREEGVEAEVDIVLINTEDSADRYRFTGSPTIRINDQDIDPLPEDAMYGLACRGYQLEDGRISPLPPMSLIRHAVQRAKSA